MIRGLPRCGQRLLRAGKPSCGAGAAGAQQVGPELLWKGARGGPAPGEGSRGGAQAASLDWDQGRQQQRRQFGEGWVPGAGGGSIVSHLFFFKGGWGRQAARPIVLAAQPGQQQQQATPKPDLAAALGALPHLNT